MTGVCGAAKVDVLRALGADDVVDYTRDEIPRGRLRPVVGRTYALSEAAAIDHLTEGHAYGKLVLAA